MQFAETVRKGPAGSLINRLSSHQIVRELHTGVNVMRLFPRSTKNVDFEFGDQLEMKVHAQFEPEESGASGAHWINYILIQYRHLTRKMFCPASVKLLLKRCNGRNSRSASPTDVKAASRD